MARLPRIDLPGVPRHIVQRGNNRLPCFLDDQDRRNYLFLLGEALRATHCQLHAYVLMDNHVHLLATPGSAGAVARLMQILGRRYVPIFNARHERTGTLWEGRYRASLVDSETYVLRCQRYIELNPTRARMVDDPATYRWSSCAAHLGLRSDTLLKPHPAWLALGSTPDTRAAHYLQLLGTSIPEEELLDIRRHLQQQRALGDTAFQAMIEAMTQRF
ncbi:MAG TPA: transposase, partial [Stenotrophomonas sp.]